MNDDQDDKDYTDYDEPVILTDSETGEPYYRTTSGEKVWVD